MVVRLDKVPPALDGPKKPRLWLWLLPLPALLTLGVALTLWLGGEGLAPARFWLFALGIPALVWCAAVLVRGLIYLGELSSVEGWNEAREADLTQKMRRGRRSQQVLAVSLHTALRDLTADNGQAQHLALVANDGSQLRAQPGWQGSARHSRLPLMEVENQERLLRRVLVSVLGDLAAKLSAFPSDKPVALLLEMDSGLEEGRAGRVWNETLAESGIRQTLKLINGSGMAAIDQWLDERIRDEALLMVVSFQIARGQVEGSAESVVGLLLGNRLTQERLPALAYLHRPEPTHGTDKKAALQATAQALDWVPLPASSIGRVWLAGTDASRNALITSAMESVELPAKATHNLGALLGDAGKASPWMAIASAVEATASEAEPQFIFTGDSAEDACMWCSVVMPAAVPQE
ncbi:hypothetical protein IB274_14570 [Pseudomonas sp. PDM18]|uniref:hypothetical protein n=1 Tax=Pseudomonas sp. PDM18 TaxID=2769253 RepID=UPI00177EA266|nr:hypothetical protein [Pseudomonas sp. PDM18]MBD9677934.1 hypothetical protein [Pseudomonas sp. PDM18]